ncbi:EthD family reductase [Paenacidovorax monticola]|uniref:EthD family reductase n=1 Tax=Paenacidovorax monticola TaxID=1926868 RepID=A0A7H0HHV7_9BURK|nr:EthD family reductase [Paenacidovorax monticola]QNP60123.1 EthD family reductase [Paenacidovorax monticola]
MIKVTGIYRWREGATFDHAYYEHEHMRITREALAPLGLMRLESDRMLHARDPGPGQVVAISHAYFASLPEAQAAVRQAGATLMADVPRYTNLQPETHFSEVRTHS